MAHELTASSPRILVVDDERAIVETLMAYLARLGIDAVGAYSVDEAQRLVASDASICVVVSDVSMPGRTGLALAEELLAERDEARALEVIIITGFATTETAIAAMRAQVFDLVKKPFRLAEIAEVVVRATASSLARRARAAREAEIRQRSRVAEEERLQLMERLVESESGLEHTRTALERSEQARFNLLAIVSHELRSPLIPIIGFSEVIASAPELPPGELREYAMLIHDAGKSLLKLIEVALDVVALQDGSGLGPAARERVATFAARVCAPYAAAAEARRIPLVLEGPAELMAYGDIQRIERALSQLLDNAIKASPEGMPVTLRWQAHGPHWTRIGLLDHGPGIPADVLAQLGTPFLQKDMSLTRKWPGAGLGLALAKRVAEAHGGELWLMAGEAGGCEATLLVPTGTPA